MKKAQVFVTSVESPMGVSALAPALNRLVGKRGWNFDLDDCDRILRVTGSCQPQEVIGLLEEAGFRCAELSDDVPMLEWNENSRMAS